MPTRFIDSLTVAYLRWFAVVVGLICTQAILGIFSAFSASSSGVDIFPVGALLFGAIAASVSVICVGMFYEFRKGSVGPLLTGIIGCGLIWFQTYHAHVV